MLGGNGKFISQYVTLSEADKTLAEELASQGKTPIYLAIDENKLIGILAVADTIKEDGILAIKELKEMNYSVVMLTGDNAKTAEAIGKQAGVDRVIADVLPDGKEEVVRELMKEHRVIMVGDGINDAPCINPCGYRYGDRSRNRCCNRCGRCGTDAGRSSNRSCSNPVKYGNDTKYQREPVLGIYL